MKTENATANIGSTCVADASTRSFTPPATVGSQDTAAVRQLPPNDPHCEGYQWFPMYVMYRQELKVQKELHANHFETFIPMQERATRRKGIDKVEAVPAIHNMIFVYSRKERISWMKMHNKQCTIMQYMSFRSYSDGTSTVITVPPDQMQNIIRAATALDPEGQRSYIDTPASPGPARPNRQIEFVSGPFKGVTGIIRRINKNRVMLVELPQYKSIQIKITRAQDINYK
ncbi:MAG: UpxY family transcription antiterminator [Desulfovibrionaceae bacterium]|nr:UpxY family transcription antiterminator [Desulfovibrionaceae bacterium]